MIQDDLTFGQRLKRCLSDNNMTQKQLSIELKIPESTMSTYCRDLSQPDIDTIVKLSKSLNTSVQYLLTGEKITSVNKISELEEINYDPKLRAIYNRLVKLTPENLELASDHLEVIIKRQNNNNKTP